MLVHVIMHSMHIMHSLHSNRHCPSPYQQTSPHRPITHDCCYGDTLYPIYAFLIALGD